VIADAQGAPVEETAFYPFGIPRNEYRLRGNGEPYRFAQKERDRESGLHYFEARYASSAVVRFLSVDPKYAHPDGLPNEDLAAFLSNPQEMNLYAYAGNNALSYVDPTGLGPMDGMITKENWERSMKNPPTLSGFLNSVQLVVGGIACGTGNPFGCAAAAHAVDQLQSEARGTRPLTAQAITAVTGSKKAGDWGNVGIGIALSLGSGPRVPTTATSPTVVATTMSGNSAMRVGAARTVSGEVAGGGGVFARTGTPTGLAPTLPAPGGTMATGAGAIAGGGATGSAAAKAVMQSMQSDPYWGPLLRQVAETSAARCMLPPSEAAASLGELHAAYDAAFKAAKAAK
jgi:RHS repeat-associated protein